MKSRKFLRISAIAAGAVVSAHGAVAQTVFFEDFGAVQQRVTSPHVPSRGVDSSLGMHAFYQFSAAGFISDGEYAILPPTMFDATNVNANWPRLAQDHTPGDGNGALMVLNAGDHRNQFYRRVFTVEAGKSYRFSAWRYVVNGDRTGGGAVDGPISWRLEAQQINSEASLGNSGYLTNTGVRRWEQSTWDFSVPTNCSSAAGPLQLVGALRNGSEVMQGNDLYIDDISVVEISSAGTAISCPTERVYVVEARDDSAQTLRNTSVDVPVLRNDAATLGAGSPGNALVNSSVQIVTQPAIGGVATATAAGTVSFVPSNNFTGVTQFTYQVCNDAPNPVCDTAVATVSVSAGAINAADGSTTVTVSQSAQPALNVLTDSTLAGNAATSTNTVVSVVENPGNSPALSLNSATGQVAVAAGTPPGIYTLEYQICESNIPANCDSATVTVQVSAGDLMPAAIARDTHFSTQDQRIDTIHTEIVFGGTTPADWSALDVAVTSPAQAVQPGQPVPSLDPVTGEVLVPANTPPGTYTIGLSLCERALGTENCAAVTVQVEVLGVIDAVDVTAPPIRAGAGGQTDYLFGETILNGQPTSLEAAIVTQTQAAEPVRPNASVPVLDGATGTVAVPAGTPPGTYTIGFQICDRTDANVCDEAVLTIVVTADALTPVPVDNPIALLLAGMGMAYSALRLRRQRNKT